MSAAITMSLIVGWFLGFVTYYGFRVGYKAVMQELTEAHKEQKKDPESCNSQGL